MAQEWARGFYNSALWKKQREYILKRDNFTCTEVGCGKTATEVHHIIELTKDNINDVRICLDESNLRSLCHDCHTAITKASKSNAINILEDIVFDSNGFPISAREFEVHSYTRPRSEF